MSSETTKLPVAERTTFAWSVDVAIFFPAPNETADKIREMNTNTSVMIRTICVIGIICV